jgi:hypothetical protein
VGFTAYPLGLSNRQVKKTTCQIVSCPAEQAADQTRKENQLVSAEEKEACRIVENLLRSLGGKCIEVVVTPKQVQVAPVEWAGDSTGKTLADALEDALKSL